MILTAVNAAESTGRAAWRQLEEDNNYGKLNELLTANGFNPVNRDWWDHYNYPDVINAVAETNSSSQLKVRWNS